MGTMLTVGQAARRAGVDPSTIRRWTKSGALPAAVTPGGDRRIDTDDLDTLLMPSTVDLGTAAPPERAVPHWAVVSSGWGGWRPPIRLGEDQLARLRQDAENLRNDLGSVVDAITLRLRQLDSEDDGGPR